jgi:hypothetical protein
VIAIQNVSFAVDLMSQEAYGAHSQDL